MQRSFVNWSIRPIGSNGSAISCEVGAYQGILLKKTYQIGNPLLGYYYFNDAAMWMLGKFIAVTTNRCSGQLTIIYAMDDYKH
jgi:hypothetical protein